MKKVFIIFLLSLFMLLTGCHVSMIGTSSFSMISDQINETNSEVKVIGEETSKSDTAFFGLCYVLPIIGKTQLSHEVVVDEFLDENKADLILNAQLKTISYGIPLLFHIVKVKVEGTPAVFINKEHSTIKENTTNEGGK